MGRKGWVGRGVASVVVVVVVELGVRWCMVLGGR